MQNLLNAYCAWLPTQFKGTMLGNVLEITTPFLDKHRDHLQVYVKQVCGTLILTDIGYTATQLSLSGCDPETEISRAVVSNILRSYGITWEGQKTGQEMWVEATEDTFSQQLLNLIQAMQAVECSITAICKQQPVATSLEGLAEAEDDDKDIRLPPIDRYTMRVKINSVKKGEIR